MVIQHNISALNAHRNMGLNNGGISKNLEKLSSGYRVNRAADDAAGLAISEKMRGQIRGLEMAEQNTSHGINLIQTAEGGLNETHSILQRMRELAVQSSNGTYQDVDREQLTKEFNALMSEVDRISESTHYNNIKLLDGSLSTAQVGDVTRDIYSMFKNIDIGGGYNKGDIISLTTGTYVPETVSQQATQGTLTTAAVAVGGLTAGETLSFDIGDVTYTTEALVAADIASADGLAKAMAAAINKAGGNSDWTVRTDGAGALIFTSKQFGPDASQVAVQGISVTNLTRSGAGGANPTIAAGGTYVGGLEEIVDDPELGTVAISINGVALTGAILSSYDRSSDTFTVVDERGSSYTLDASKIRADNQNIMYRVGEGENLVFQIGANGGQDQRVNLGVDNMSSKNIGLRAGDIKSDGKGATAGEAAMLSTASIDTVENANRAIDIIHAATNQVSGQRAELGALQNRLEHTMNNLGVTKENLTAAESTIRDVDMAKEMMEFTKNNILVQASQAMLAQANQLPQGVLQLLR